MVNQKFAYFSMKIADYLFKIWWESEEMERSEFIWG